jgi:hypothetical protein
VPAALFLRDITFIRDGNSDTKDYQINMEKIELQVKIEPRFPLAPLLLCSVCVGAGPRLIADCARPVTRGGLLGSTNFAAAGVAANAVHAQLHTRRGTCTTESVRGVGQVLRTRWLRKLTL